uniref:Uncharacterized protein n=1 Tax=Lepeophtheirus salmonis TaxID=72036 RepID=A0A0K2U6X4_LEPSM
MSGELGCQKLLDTFKRSLALDDLLSFVAVVTICFFLLFCSQVIFNYPSERNFAQVHLLGRTANRHHWITSKVVFDTYNQCLCSYCSFPTLPRLSGDCSLGFKSLFNAIHGRPADLEVIGNLGRGLLALEHFQHKISFGFHFVVFLRRLKKIVNIYK